MAEKVYILFSRDAHKKRRQMKIQGVTTEESALHAMIANMIGNGEAGYGGHCGTKASRAFYEDFISETIDYGKLSNGMVKEFENIRLEEHKEEHLTLEFIYEDMMDMKACQAIEKLDMDSHSFVFSTVHLWGDRVSCFNMPGKFDYEHLIATKEYQEFAENFRGGSDENVPAVMSLTYRVGIGECRDATEEELKAVEKYYDALDTIYNVEEIDYNFFFMQYEAKQEQEGRTP